MDITSLYNVTSGAVRQAEKSSSIGRQALEKKDGSFQDIFQKAMDWRGQSLNTDAQYRVFCAVQCW